MANAISDATLPSVYDQLRASGWGGEWNAAGVDRYKELADLLTKAGVTDINQLQLDTSQGGSFAPMTGTNASTGEAMGTPDSVAYQMGRLKYGNNYIGYLGDYNNNGTYGSNAGNYLQGGEVGSPYRAGWSSQGAGNVSYMVQTDPATGQAQIVPTWGSSSDAGDARQAATIVGGVLAGGYGIDAAAGAGAAGAAGEAGSAAAGGGTAATGSGYLAGGSGIGGDVLLSTGEVGALPTYSAGLDAVGGGAVGGAAGGLAGASTGSASNPALAESAVGTPGYGASSAGAGGGSGTLAPAGTAVASSAAPATSGGSTVASGTDWGSIWPQLLSAGLQTYGAQSAARAQSGATQAAIDEQRRQFDLTRGDYAPYREAGVNALGQLQTDMNAPVTAADVMQDPGYQFGLNQGQTALDRKIASMGGRVSGASLKAADRYATDYASTGYGAAYQRRQDRLNRLASLAGLGQTSTAGSAAAGTNSANAISGLISSQGDANAAARLATGNIWGNAINQQIGYGQRNRMTTQPVGGSSPYYASWDNPGGP